MFNVLKSQLGDSLKSVRRFLAQPVGARRGHAATGAPVRQTRSPSDDEQRQRTRRMRRDLYQLMEQHPSSRQLMRHLGLVEQTLHREGFAGVEALPVRVVAKALSQLERLVWDWTAEGLAELRSRMAVIVKNRPARVARPDAEGALEDAAPPELYPTVPHAPDVTEVEPSDLAMFDDMERSWAGQMPESIAKAAAAAKAPHIG